jgi:peptide/nickel transport system substrate-binding protein
MLIETHSDNPAVPDGHTRFTIDIIQNATWSDGDPLTAEDVAFSFTYAMESITYGNPASTDIGDLVAAYATTTSRVIVEFATETYWHFSNFAYDTIIPEHIFNDDTGIGYAGWNTWNPVFDPAEPNVNCGPFVFSDYEAGEFYKLEANPIFHYSSLPITNTAETTNSTTTMDASQTSGQELSWSDVTIYAIGTSSGMVILFCIAIIIRERQIMKTI